MDPRRRLDEKHDRRLASRVPLIAAHRETVLEPQQLGAPLEREVIVVRIDSSALKLYGGLAALVVVTIALSLIFA